MKSEEIRRRFLEFFRARGHAVIPSASLVPENDPTTLFTGSGMQPLLPYLLGEAHPEGTRLVNSQKCFRAEDIEEVGDNRHLTFFEMLGNWSLGDYFKEEQLRWFFEFLVDEIGLDPRRLYVTAFIGDEKAGVPKDTGTAALWRELFKKKGIDAKEADIGEEEDGYMKGMKEGERIFFYRKKNWWNRGKPSPETTPVGDPAGPDSEVFFDFGPTISTGQARHDAKWGEHCHPNCDCGRFVEIGNSVFVQYVKQEDGSFKELLKRSVDFGGGLERITAAANNTPDIFEIDTLAGVIKWIESGTGRRYAGEADKSSWRIIANHLRAAVFMIDDSVTPSNTEQGYILRRLLRSAVVHADNLGVEQPLSKIVPPVFERYRHSYAELKKEQADIAEIIEKEEVQFRKTLERGMREFEKRFQNGLTANDVFDLYQTYGFPFEMTQELVKEKGGVIDIDAFREKTKKHQELSRAGAEKKFKGGLADTSEISVKYHTATHLLHQALRSILGGHVFQKGSNITPERLRFDFSHGAKMTDGEKKKVEDLVNEKIREALPVTYEDIPLEEAKRRGAVGLFGEKYGDIVRIYQIGEGDKEFSLEFCGGPHVKNTSELGHFKILKEEAVAAGVRRIKAILESGI